MTTCGERKTKSFSLARERASERLNQPAQEQLQQLARASEPLNHPARDQVQQLARASQRLNQPARQQVQLLARASKRLNHPAREQLHRHTWIQMRHHGNGDRDPEEDRLRLEFELRGPQHTGRLLSCGAHLPSIGQSQCRERLHQRLHQPSPRSIARLRAGGRQIWRMGRGFA